MLFALLLLLVSEPVTAYKNTLSINPISATLLASRAGDFLLPAPSVNYERKLSKLFSVYGEVGMLFAVIPANIEVGVFEYLSDDFKGWFLSQGVEFTFIGFFGLFKPAETILLRTPIDFGYKWIFSNNFTLRVFGGFSFYLYEFIKGDLKVPIPDSFGIYLGKSW